SRPVRSGNPVSLLGCRFGQKTPYPRLPDNEHGLQFGTGMNPVGRRTDLVQISLPGGPADSGSPALNRHRRYTVRRILLLAQAASENPECIFGYWQSAARSRLEFRRVPPLR